MATRDIGELTAELRELTALFGLSGFEESVAECIVTRLSDAQLTATRDTLGNVLLVGSERPSLLVTAHMDQVGYLVSRVEAESAHCLQVGSPAVPAGRSVAVRIVGDRHGPLEGFLESMGDIGGVVRTDRPGNLSVGDRVVYAPRLDVEDAAMISGPSLDDRIGCLIALRVAEALARDHPHVAFAWTVREESERAGAIRVASDLDPNWLIATDITYATGADEAVQSPVLVGEGPVITLLDGGMVGHAGLMATVAEAAAKLRLRWQREVVRSGASEAGAVQSTLGIPSLALLVAVENPHSPDERADMSDVVAAIELLTEVVPKLGR